MSESNVSPTEALREVAKKRAKFELGQIYVLTTGVRVRPKGVGWGLLTDIAAHIPDPPVPMWHNPKTGKDEENPLDPRYNAAKVKVNEQREQAQAEAIALFGFDLVDGVPSDEEWLPQLQFLERRGRIDLGDVDLNNAAEREFLYKRHVAASLADFKALYQLSADGTITQEGIRLAEASFPGDEGRLPD